MRNKKIMLIEPTVNWHYLFNKKIIQNIITDEVHIEYVGRMSLDEMKAVIPNIKKISVNIIPKDQNEILLYWQLGKKIFKTDINKIIFLSYENKHIIYIIAIKLILRVNIYMIEHNNIPAINDGLLKKIVFAIGSKFVKRIVLSKRAKKHLEKTYKVTPILLPHPVENAEKNNGDQGYIFSPSGTTTDDENEMLVKKFENDKKKIIIKSNTYQKNSELVTTSREYNNYFELMQNAEAVFVGVSGFEFRESGPVYEALALGKIVIMPRGAYQEELCANGYNVIILEDYRSKPTERAEKNNKFMREHGDEAVARILKKITMND